MTDTMERTYKTAPELQAEHNEALDYFIQAVTTMDRYFEAVEAGRCPKCGETIENCICEEN